VFEKDLFVHLGEEDGRLVFFINQHVECRH
jgi:hypothetical protein